MEITSTTTVCISARLISESGIVDEKAPQTHGWRYRVTGRFRTDQEAVDYVIGIARGRYGATHENFKLDKTSDNYTRVPDPQARGGYRFEALYQYAPGEYGL